MRFSRYHVFLCLVFSILLFAESDGKKTKNVTRVDESIFADVVKNITRVNNVLEDLIKNYKQLQKMYQTDEAFDENYSLDAENDKLNQIGKNIEKMKLESTTKKSGDLATQMFISEEKKKVSKENEIDNSREKKRKPNFEYLKNAKELKSNYDTQTDSYSYDLDNLTEDTYVFVNSSASVESADVSETAKTVDPLRTHSSQSTPSDVPIDNNKPKFHAVKRHKNKTHSNKINDLGNGPIRVSLLNNSNAVWKIELSDIFSQNDAAEEYDTNSTEDLRKSNNKVRSNLRTAGGEHKKKKMRSVSSEKDNDVTSNSEESIEENKKLEKEEFKTKILRMAYRDACLKVVINKCYKACKAALSNTCRSYNCNDGLKNKFKEDLKTGCDLEFNELPDNLTAHGFRDISKLGYLAAACLPKTYVEPVQKSNNGELDLPALQHRFERACQNISSEKCNSACNYAVTKTCSIYPCVDMKESFKEGCMEECRVAYVSESSDIDLDNRKDRNKTVRTLKTIELIDNGRKGQNNENVEGERREHVKQTERNDNYKKKEHSKTEKNEFRKKVLKVKKFH